MQDFQPVQDLKGSCQTRGNHPPYNTELLHPPKLVATPTSKEDLYSRGSKRFFLLPPDGPGQTTHLPLNGPTQRVYIPVN